jgi:hypothetical protein
MLTIQNADDFIITLPPIIDEQTEFPEKKPRLSQRVIFDCAEISVVNSFGMHKWIIWMRGLNANAEFHFRNCHRKVIDMINAVEGFIPENSVVDSFFMPYNCEKCDGEDSVLLTRGKEFVENTPGQKSRLLYPNQLNCPKCRNSMDVAVLENMFLRFLDRKEKEI